MEPETDNQEDMIKDIMSFDPFAQMETDSAEQEGGTDDAQKPAQSAGSDIVKIPQPAPGPEIKPDPAEAPPSSGPAPQAPQSDEIAALRAQIQQMNVAMAQLRQAPQPPAQPQAQPKNPNDEIAAKYATPVPKVIMDALASEDPSHRQQGVTALIQGIGVMVHRNVLEETRKMISSQVPALLQHRDTMKSTVESVRKSFYGKFTELDNPVLYPVVQQTAAELMQRNGWTDWNEGVRDAVGAEVKQRLAAAMGGFVQPQAATAPAQLKPVPKRPFMSSGAPARPQPQSSDPNDPKNIASALGFT